MVPLMVILTIVMFLIVDVATRMVIKSLRESKLRKRREEALDIGLKLEYDDEAKSLKRVEVSHPVAKILAVDDEQVVLDSFRKILVLAGYSIDTVETGREAVGLVRKNDYDFVFTDLKMPEMDGLDVTKAVKHYRPDIDVVMITGYATIESAVDAMKFGAMDYVQKPFTADELSDFVEKLVIRREDRIRRSVRPEVHLITPSVAASSAENEFNVPAGIFVAPEHTWINIQPNGMLLVGLDDFAGNVLGPIDVVDLPEPNQLVAKGDPLFAIHHDSNVLSFPSPATGMIVYANDTVANSPELVNSHPFEAGWICGIEPTSLPADLQTFRLGADAVGWYEEEIDRYTSTLKALTDQEGEDDVEEGQLKWKAFSELIRKVGSAGEPSTSMEGVESA
ncbi:response regulator [Bacteroidota bacterium]